MTTDARLTIALCYGLLTVLTIILTVLKITNVMPWPWHDVLAPLWISAAASVGVYIISFLVGIFTPSTKK